MNIPIMELVELMHGAKQKITVSDFMTSQNYINLDTDAPVSDDLNENWED